jgi:hypothetical protein
MSMNARSLLRCLAVLSLTLNVATASAAENSYQELVSLFQRWRTFEVPERLDGAPDYTAAAMQRKHEGLRQLQAELAAMDVKGWPVEQQVDYHLVRAEMNGLDFRLRVLAPWQRDPSFYASIRTSQSDTPAEEGPTIHGAVRLWKYPFWPQTSLSVLAPLSAADQQRLARELQQIPPLLEQARKNLTGNARDLWVGGIKTHQQQGATLAQVAEKTKGASRELRAAVEKARSANRDFVAWLQQQAPAKTGPSGLGKDDYTWHLRNVLLVPMTWQDEVTIMQRELARAHASLLLEEQRNRQLPPLDPVAGPEQFAQLQDRSIRKYLDFMEKKEILPVKPYYEQALRERVFEYSPEATRHFFHQATHREPMTLWTHFYHYWDMAQAQAEPHASQIRRSPSLYNIWMNRAEGMATVMEEWMMHAGLYDDNPRAREIVWIMLANRAARGLSSLYAFDNRVTMAGASDMHVNGTPRGWMRRDLDLLGFEQLLYMRQPGYGPSYVTGARMLDALMMERKAQLGDQFTMRGFFAEVNAAGMIPVSLLRWQLTGHDDEIRELLRVFRPEN